MALPAVKLVDLDVSPDTRLETLQRDYAELNTAIFEAAQVHRRLCAPSLVRHGAFDVASEIFAVRHLPGDFFSVEETADGLVFALGDIGGKGLAAGMWVTHLIGLIRTHTAVSSDPEAIVSGVNRETSRLSAIEPLSTLFVGRLNSETGQLDYCSAGHPAGLLLRVDATARVARGWWTSARRCSFILICARQRETRRWRFAAGVF